MTKILSAEQAMRIVQAAIRDARQRDEPIPLEGDEWSIRRAIHEATGIPTQVLEGLRVSADSRMVPLKCRNHTGIEVLLQRLENRELQYYIDGSGYAANLP